MTTAPPSGPANTVGSQRQDHPQHQVTGRREPGARGAIEAGTAAPDRAGGGALGSRPLPG